MSSVVPTLYVKKRNLQSSHIIQKDFPGRGKGSILLEIKRIISKDMPAREVQFKGRLGRLNDI